MKNNILIMFLTVNDYQMTIRQDILQTITDNQQNVRTQAERTAQATMESYLRNHYDVVQIFSTEGAARNPLIVTYMMDITLYHILSRISPNNIPELRNNRYLDAIDWLKRVSRGDISPDLPSKGEEVKSGYLRLGSASKQSSYW